MEVFFLTSKTWSNNCYYCLNKIEVKWAEFHHKKDIYDHTTETVRAWLRNFNASIYI